MAEPNSGTRLSIATRLARAENKRRDFFGRCYPLEGGCIGFRGTHDAWGYPKFVYEGRQRPASHVAMFYAGWSCPLPGQVNHRCDNPACVNADHLIVGTQADNIADCVAKRRHAHGEKHTISKLTDDAVRDIRQNCTERGQPKLYAEKYGVSISTIWAARSRQNWKHLND